MHRIAVNTIRHKSNEFITEFKDPAFDINVPVVLPPKTKILAWTIFLIYFIESGTLGLIPKDLYFVYRNVRVSDFLIYGIIIYSFINIKEYKELYRSKALIIIKLWLIYLLAQFFMSSILYDYNVLEYFFRLKDTWTSFLVFPFLLLLERKGLPYLIKLILPVAIISNILYILSSLSGIAFLPQVEIVKQSLPGGLEVYRVFGGTFFGEFFFLGFIYKWITDKFRLYQLFLVILFVLPQILAFGRSAWVYYTFTLFVMFVWNTLRNKELRQVIRQVVMFSLVGISLIYVFMTYIPSSDYLTDAIQARIEQGESDVTNKEGTYGTRLNSINALLELWSKSNLLFGIGMHPMWVVKPVTQEEIAYAWGFSDVGWASVLAAYGLVGFGLAIFYQIYLSIASFNIIKRAKRNDIYTFLVLIFLTRLFFDSVFNYSTRLFSTGLSGFGVFAVFIASVVYKHEHQDD